MNAVAAQGAGFLAEWPCGEPQPNSSSVNYTTGDTIPNAVIAKIGSAGKVCIFTLAALDLVIDVNGYFPATT